MSQSNQRRLAIIGASVGVATAGVITFLVVTGEAKEEDPPRELSRPTAAVEMPKATAEVGPVTPSPPVATLEGSTTASARKKADTKLARQQAIEAARKHGILGSTALTQSGSFASLTGTARGIDGTNVHGSLIGNEAGEMNGGFGLGKPPGGGGTGWGAIGDGYGSLGHGNGSGRAPATSRISIGQATVVPTVASSDEPGSLDKAIIRRYIKRKALPLQACYEKELVAKATLAGTVKAQFTITESGSVGSASASGVDPDVSSCMAAVIKGIQFPRPKGTGGVSVTYPFTVR